MNKHASGALALLLGLALGSCNATQRLEYPAADRGDQVDVYHGEPVADPYRWLEDSSSDETRSWVEAQNALTESFLREEPVRVPIYRRLVDLWDQPHHGVPLPRGRRVFFTRNDGQQDQSMLYVRDPGSRYPRVLIDPSRLSPDGSTALAAWEPSWNGRLLAFATTRAGSDWRAWRVVHVASGEVTSDLVSRNKFGGLLWSSDDQGFFYARYDSPRNQPAGARDNPPAIAYHALGTPEQRDEIVVPAPTGEGVNQTFALSSDRSALIVNRQDVATQHHELTWYPLEGAVAGTPMPLVRGFDARYTYLGDDGDIAWVLTDWRAPRRRVIGIPITTPERELWTEIVPEEEDTLDRAAYVGGRLFLTYLRDAACRVTIQRTDGREERRIPLLGLGTVRGFLGDATSGETYYSYTDFLTPPRIYRYDIARGESELFFKPDLPFDANRYEVYQVTYESDDAGTRVPMFVVHRRGIEHDGSNPTYLYGYGGFGVTLTPSFDVQNLVWLELGGILAVPNIRGGGEFGESWHSAGTKLEKQNVFDDFKGAARWLVRNGYTRPSRLAIGGDSNGGLLVGACMTQEPWLFGAALPAVGVFDMLRYHLFTIGWAWAGDYGTVEDSLEFRALRDYSPVHNVTRGRTYPATLVTTADGDDRVVPAHSYKFVAALQHAQGGDAPILLRVAPSQGHGAGRSAGSRLAEAVDRLTFLYRVLGLDADLR